MLVLLIAYLGGVLTILNPCILPVLPFVFARADRSFGAHGLPTLLGLALAFVAVATLATVGGGWAASLNAYGRYAAIGALSYFGLALLFPALADRMNRPLVAVGVRLVERDRPTASPASSLLLGVGTGLLWAPCAGPILGLILTGAALEGAGARSLLLLLAYAAGACTSLAAALAFGGRLLSLMKRSIPAGEWMRRASGAAVLGGVGAIALGLDTDALARVPAGPSTALEQALVEKLQWHKPRQALAVPTAWRGAGTFLRTKATSPAGGTRADLPVEGQLRSFEGATEWINTGPLTPQALRGKVVLVDFWTYSCINCLRTLPYVRAWAQKYQQAGLVVVGVHSPEFAFEKRSANVHRAVKDLGITYPVAVDSDLAIWRTWGNQYWPAFYLVDAQGRIRRHQFGEGGYGRMEEAIQQLLAEAGQRDVPGDEVSPQGAGTQAPADAEPALSQETYLGAGREAGFASPGGIDAGRPHRYSGDASLLRPDQWTLSGNWTVEPECALLNEAGGRIAYRFRARDLHLVLGTKAQGSPVRFRVRIDGEPPGADHGADIDEQGLGTVEAHKLYQLVRQQQENRRPRLFEIEFLDPGAQAYAFTFG